MKEMNNKKGFFKNQGTFRSCKKQVCRHWEGYNLCLFLPNCLFVKYAM